jgi:hypothetical protein
VIVFKPKNEPTILSRMLDKLTDQDSLFFHFDFNNGGGGMLIKDGDELFLPGPGTMSNMRFVRQHGPDDYREMWASGDSFYINVGDTVCVDATFAKVFIKVR